MTKRFWIKDNEGNRYEVVKRPGGWTIRVFSQDGVMLGDPRAEACFKSKRFAMAVAEAMVDHSNRKGGR